MMADISLTGVLVVAAIAFAVPLVLGLAFLLFLAGLEIDLDRLRGARLRSAATGFVVSLAIALGIGLGLYAAGLIQAPLLVAIILSSTSLGIVIPVLADAGQSNTALGQLIIAGSSIADFGAIILLSLFYSGDSSSAGSTLLLLIGLVVVAQLFGLELILGAFFAGAVLRLLDRDEMMTHTVFQTKLQAVGFGVFIPFFFMTSGMQLDVGALLSGGAALALVPVLLLALLLARGVPAALYRPMVGERDSLAAALLQATSLPFIVATTGIGMELGILSPAIGAAMVVAGLLSVVLFPLGALTLLRGGGNPGAVAQRDSLDDAGGDEPGPT